MSEQFTEWRVCQICGRAIHKDEAGSDGWLVGTYKRKPHLLVVRCYRHWSEWSMRMSVGRTNENRQKAADGKRRAAEEGEGMHPYAEPFPLTDESP